MPQETRSRLLRMADGFEVMAIRVERRIVSKDSLAESLRRQSNELKRIATYDDEILGGS